MKAPSTLAAVCVAALLIAVAAALLAVYALLSALLGPLAR